MKYKFDRRRALDCKLIKKSDTYKGYYKYEVTIGEKDGTIHNEKISSKESISLPNSLEIFNFLAILPSIVSRAHEIKIK